MESEAIDSKLVEKQELERAIQDVRLFFERKQEEKL